MERLSLCPRRRRMADEDGPAAEAPTLAELAACAACAERAVRARHVSFGATAVARIPHRTEDARTPPAWTLLEDVEDDEDTPVVYADSDDDAPQRLADCAVQHNLRAAKVNMLRNRAPPTYARSDSESDDDSAAEETRGYYAQCGHDDSDSEHDVSRFFADTW